MFNEKYQVHYKVVPILLALKIVGFKKHRISMATAMIASSIPSFLVEPHWIQMPVIGTYADYLEVVPYEERDKDLDVAFHVR